MESIKVESLSVDNNFLLFTSKNLILSKRKREMKYYIVDLGSWESGRTVSFHAISREKAFSKATSLLLDDEDIVQVKEYNDIGTDCIAVWDYYNFQWFNWWS